MSNNPTPPRIEREAEKFGFQVPYNGTNEFYNKDRLEGFKSGATAEHNRAAPVVKALEEAYSIIANVCGGHPLLGELKQILETYKADQ